MIKVNKEKLKAVRAEALRLERNALLKESDWTVLPDSPVNVDLWKAYRQSLRDIPQQESFPDEISFPEKPETSI